MYEIRARGKVSVIFCCGMRRSASTLQYHLVRELLPHYADLGHTTWQSFDYVPDSIVKCHPFLPDYNPQAKHCFEVGYGMIVYIYRDIRDVVASMLRMEKDTGYSFISNLEDDITAILSSFYKWTSLSPIYISRYEDLNLETEIRGIAEFLDVEPNLGLIKKYSLEEQRKRQPKDEWSPQTTMHPHHIGTGEVGQWKHSLTQGQLDTVYKIAGNWLKELGYK